MSLIKEAIKGVKNEVDRALKYRTINYGGEALYVEGFSRVLNISDEEMRFSLRHGEITVSGENLTVAFLAEGACLIEGIIACVRSDYADGNKKGVKKNAD